MFERINKSKVLFDLLEITFGPRIFGSQTLFFFPVEFDLYILWCYSLLFPNINWYVCKLFSHFFIMKNILWIILSFVSLCNSNMKLFNGKFLFSKFSSVKHSNAWFLQLHSQMYLKELKKLWWLVSVQLRNISCLTWRIMHT